MYIRKSFLRRCCDFDGYLDCFITRLSLCAISIEYYLQMAWINLKDLTRRHSIYLFIPSILMIGWGVSLYFDAMTGYSVVSQIASSYMAGYTLAALVTFSGVLGFIASLFSRRLIFLPAGMLVATIWGAVGVSFVQIGNPIDGVIFFLLAALTTMSVIRFLMLR